MHARISNAPFRCCLTLLSISSRRTPFQQNPREQLKPAQPSKLSVLALSSYLHAEIVYEQVHASSVVLARTILAHPNVNFTVDTDPSLRTCALEPTDFVPTRGAVQTRIGLAVVDVNFARGSGVAFATVTHEGVVQIDATICTNWITGLTETLVQFCLALETNEARPALADESF